MIKWHKPTRLQLYSFVASMPIISILLNFIMYHGRIFHDVRIWLVSFPLIFLIGIGSWRGHILIGNYIKHRFAGLKQTKKRILIQVFCLIPFMSLSVTLIFVLYDALHILGYNFSMEDFKQGLIVGFCVNLIFETLYEADYVLERYKESVEEKQHMQQLSNLHEFDTLKNQVNPHFLFNSLTSLSSLIRLDQEMASDFLERMSKIYRYILKNRHTETVTLSEELNFVSNFIELQKARFETALVDESFDIALE